MACLQIAQCYFTPQLASTTVLQTSHALVLSMNGPHHSTAPRQLPAQSFFDRSCPTRLPCACRPPQVHAAGQGGQGAWTAVGRLECLQLHAPAVQGRPPPWAVPHLRRLQPQVHAVFGGRQHEHAEWRLQLPRLHDGTLSWAPPPKPPACSCLGRTAAYGLTQCIPATEQYIVTCNLSSTACLRDACISRQPCKCHIRRQYM